MGVEPPTQDANHQQDDITFGIIWQYVRYGISPIVKEPDGSRTALFKGVGRP